MEMPRTPKAKPKAATKKKPATKKAATKRKPAAANTPPEIQRNTTASRPPEEQHTVSNATQEDVNQTSSDERDERDETQADRDAAGEARANRVRSNVSEEPEPLHYEPQRAELEHAGFDQHAAEAARQEELAAAREEHNRRTGDAQRGIPSEPGSR